jgi:hypothetical protein
VSFFVDVADPYLHDLRAVPGLTEEGSLRLLASLTDILENCTDSFRDERRLPAPGQGGSPSACFELRYVFPDGGRIFLIRLVVDDSAAQYGVLRVVFADCEAGPALS